MRAVPRVDVFEIQWKDQGLNCYTDVKARDIKQAIAKWRKDHKHVPLRAVKMVNRLTRVDR